MNPEISVIVPVYNTEKYLQECVDSILHQNFANFEMLLIDDGSTDNSGIICDQFATNNSNIIVIHLEKNNGLSIARNVGIQNSHGKYVTFVDSDDILKPNFLSVLYETQLSHDADMVITNNLEYHEDDGKYYFYITNDDVDVFDLTPQQTFSLQDNWPYNPSIFVVPFGKLVKKELLKNFRFPDHMMYEDEAAIHRLILACKKIVLVNDSLYIHRIRPNSLLASNITDKRLRDIAKAFELKMSDFVLAGINPTTTKVRLLQVIKDLMAQVPETNRHQPGYRECQEIINLANQSITTPSHIYGKSSTAIVLAADRGYLWPLSTTIKSIYANGYSGTIYVMNNNIPQEWFQTINSKLSYGLIHDLKIDGDTLMQGHINHEHINYMSYARIFAPELIKAAKLLYIDSDTVINGSLKPLLSMTLDGHLIGAVPELSGAGFNSGVLLIDGDAWRKKEVTKKLWSHIGEQDLANNDQSLLNDYFENDYLKLPLQYNYQIGADLELSYDHSTHWVKNGTPEDKLQQLDNISNPIIYHYITNDKPWNLTSSGRKRKLWWHYSSLDWDNLLNYTKYPTFNSDLFIFTNTDDLRDIEKLVSRFPDIRFNIAAYVFMSFKLKRLLQYDNVKLYPAIIGKNVERLIKISVAMLDIADTTNEEITRRFAATGKPIIGYRKDQLDDLLPAGSDYELVHNTDEMIDRINQLTNTRYGIIVKNIQQTLDFVIKNHSSVARFGDGELDLISGHSIPYQSYQPALATRLAKILHTPSSPNLVVCLSDVFHDLDRYNDYARQFWTAKLPEYAPILTTLKDHGWFGSTFISRPYIDLADKAPAKDSFNQLKQLWNNRDLLIVEGKLSRSGVGNDLFANANSIQRIIGPSHDAFARYDDLLTTIKHHAENKLILLMLGPTAKLLADDLAQDGHQAIDLGHIDSEYEWFKMGATEKVALPNKHTAEHNFDENVVVTPDKDYDSQIIADLSAPQA